MARWRATRGRFVAMTIMAAAATSSLTAQTDSHKTEFVAEIHAAMQQMMTAMDVTPTGDVDADFAAMMIPHHAGAIAMAQAELKAGRNEQLRRLAQEIIITQEQEIAVMRMAGSTHPVSHHDRVYAAEQFSNTVSVTDPADNTLLG